MSNQLTVMAQLVQQLNSENKKMLDELETVRVPTTGASSSGRACDLARYSRPGKVAGTESEFVVWDFALKCYVGAMAPELLPGLNASAGSPAAIRRESGAEKNNAMQVLSIVALSTAKGARKVVREVPGQNGFEAYRRLVNKYRCQDEQGETTGQGAR